MTAKQTRMGEAMRAAGMIPVAERLAAVITAVVQQHPRDFTAAKDALAREVQGDAALLWELFAPYRHQAMQSALSAAMDRARRQEKPRREPGPRGVGHGEIGSRMLNARPTPLTAADVYAAPRPISPAAIAAVAGVAKASLLDTFTINGQPIGSVTAREAGAWAWSRERDARFVRLLVENLPPDDPIRKWRTPEEAAKAYAAAQEKTDA